MPTAPAKACLVCGTPVPGGREELCAAHRNLAKQDYDRHRAANDPIRKFYNAVEWKRFRDWLQRLNPICQAIVGGEQCHNPGTIGHHLEDPRVAFAKRCDPSNVVMVCAAHHTHSPGESGLYQYVPTRGHNGQMHPHHAQPVPVQKKKKGGIDWDAPFSIPETA